VDFGGVPFGWHDQQGLQVLAPEVVPWSLLLPHGPTGTPQLGEVLDALQQWRWPRYRQHGLEGVGSRQDTVDAAQLLGHSLNCSRGLGLDERPPLFREAGGQGGAEQGAQRLVALLPGVELLEADGNWPEGSHCPSPRPGFVSRSNTGDEPCELGQGLPIRSGGRDFQALREGGAEATAPRGRALPARLKELAEPFEQPQRLQ
jgi:hypothetical protein